MMQPTRVVVVQRTSFEDMNCSVAQCLEVVGEWWSLLIVRDAFLGVRRFDDFQARLGISRNILNQRLTRLVDKGILERVPYQDNPPRSVYLLTAKGRDLWHVLTAMRQWGDRWAAPDGPPLRIRHATCGRVVKAVAVCSHCGEPLSVRSVAVEPGPGSVDADYERTVLEGFAR
jgi:DNA-binding HxlR family transcriptional regulator